MTSAFHGAFLVALLVPSVVLARNTSDASDQAARIERVEAGLAPSLFAADQPIRWTLAERMAHYNVPGVSVAVIHEGKIEWARGYGVLEAGGSTPVTPDTMFQAASISKPVAAAAVLRLVEAGELQLDQDVNLVLGFWKVPENPATTDEKVTLRRILSHTAGLTVHGFPGYAEGEPVPSLLQILDGEQPANTPAIRVDTVPGTRERYSGGGYVVATQLLRDVTGGSFPDLLQASVFDPLRMTRSTFEQPLPAVFAATAARAHHGDGTAIEGDWHTYPELAPDGLWTTPSDLAQFAIELQRSLQGQSNKVLTADMTRQMLTPQLGSAGLGIFVAGEGAAQRFEHGGANAGFRCNLVAYANSGRGAVIMTNSDYGSPLIQEIQRSIAVEYDWPDFQPEAVIPVEVDPGVLAGYVGRYKVAKGGSTITIRTHEGRLDAELYGERMNLIAESETRFRVAEDESAVTFFTAATGQEGLWARQNIWRKLPETPTGVSDSEESADRSALEARSAGNFLTFRNVPSWGRPTDFEDVLDELGCKSEQQTSGAMADLDLSPYDVIIIPGAQDSDYYDDYVSNVARFDDYVAGGGTLVLELNGAEGTSILLPRGVTMAAHGAYENAIVASDHPIFAPLSGKRLIRAGFASHGYLRDAPSDALVLAVEANGEEVLADRPTFIEYAHGKGRVIAASQCFHDRDGSGRGPLMEAVISHALAESWAAED